MDEQRDYIIAIDVGMKIVHESGKFRKGMDIENQTGQQFFFVTTDIRTQTLIDVDR